MQRSSLPLLDDALALQDQRRLAYSVHSSHMQHQQQLLAVNSARQHVRVPGVDDPELARVQAYIHIKALQDQGLAMFLLYGSGMRR
jgi:hypothetical protein